jgi:hypothetical protein
MINTYRLLKSLCEYAPIGHEKYVALNGIHIHRPNETDVIIEASTGITAIRVVLTNHDAALMFLPVGTDVILRADSLLVVDEADNPPLLIDGDKVWIGSTLVDTVDGQYPDIVRAMMLGKPTMVEPVHIDLDLITAVTKTMHTLGDGQSIAKFEMRGRDVPPLIILDREPGISIMAVVMSVRV